MERPLHIALGALSALIPLAVFLWPALTGQASFLLFLDAQEQTYAWWQSIVRISGAGHLPLWDAHTSSGHTLAGEIQGAVFYPLTWLWLALFASADGMPRLAIEGLVVLHFVIGSTAMYGLLRHWGVSPVASLFGALCFALFGPFAERASAQPNIFSGLCWLPLAAWFTSRHLLTRSVLWAIAAGAVIGLQILSGHAQPAFHTALICGLLCFVAHLKSTAGWRSVMMQTLRSGTPMIGAMVLVALPQLLLTAEYLSDAYRWVGGNAPIGPGEAVPRKVFLYKYTVPPSGLLSLLDPWQFRAEDANTPHLGTLGALLAIWALFWRHIASSLPGLNQHVTALRLLALFACLAMIGHLAPVGDILRKLPLIGQIRELGRYAILLHFALCVFAAAGLQHLLVNAPPARAAARGLIAIMLIGGGMTLAVTDWLSTPAQHAAWAALLVLALSQLPGLPRAVLGVAALACAIYSAQLYRPLAQPDVGAHRLAEEAFAPIPMLKTVEAEYGLARILIDDSTGLWKNYPSAHRLQGKLGHGATMYRPYFDFLALDWSLDSEVNDLLNVRYILTRESLPLPLVAKDSALGLRLFERPGAYPRVFLASGFRSEVPSSRLPRGFSLLHYEDHEMRFELELVTADTVVVSEIAYPGWCAEVNGVPKQIERAWLGEIRTPLRALSLPPGKHEVHMRYRPFARWLGGCSGD